jgi:hypothetical protein
MATYRSTKAIKEAQAEVERLVASLSGDRMEQMLVDESPRDSIYLIVSSKRNLTKKYGRRGFDGLNAEIHALKQTVNSQTSMEALVVYVDDAASLRLYGVGTADPADPAQIKMLIDALDEQMNSVGKQINYLLIVGGDTVIPFYRLPNPLDDQDQVVLSDNPYGTRGDANYLIPDRAVGRMPDGGQESTAFLINMIHNAVSAHESAIGDKGVLTALFDALRPSGRPGQNGQSFGYSASIWRKASRVVFQAVGQSRDLRISPPLTYQEFAVSAPLYFSYYNLHGVEDGPNWYGQRDSLFPANYPLFPVALRPDDLVETDHANTVVFTEACYGANIQAKTPDDSIALRFLASNALAVVGSTKIAYGAIDTPLTSADLVGKYFLEALQSCLTVGESLKVAKMHLVQEMRDRQGYLDGEDQKTLISFVLYGDPSLPASTRQCRLRAASSSKAFCPPLLCQNASRQQKSPVSDTLISAVTRQVEHSLPHMAHARIHVDPLTVCTGRGDHRCSDDQRAAKSPSAAAPSWALTLKKDIPANGGDPHHQIVKVTVDREGHILKMAMSK